MGPVILPIAAHCAVAQPNPLQR